MKWIKQAWKGKEPLWRVFWLYGLLGTIILHFLFVFYYTIVGAQVTLWSLSLFNFAISYIAVGVGAGYLGVPPSKIGSVIMLIYTVWFLIAEWRCAFNTKKKAWGYLARAHVILVIISAVVGSVSLYKVLNTADNQPAHIDFTPDPLSSAPSHTNWDDVSTPVKGSSTGN